MDMYSPNAATAKQISAPDAMTMAAVDEIVLVDIRTPGEWARSGLPQGALALSMQRQDFPQALLEALGGDMSKPVALICATGSRSAMLQRYLLAQGFSHVLDVSEGMMGNFSAPGWLRRGLPTVRYEG
ncbi:MAG TPA: rhodanese-like domain-containing protein [Rhodobacteraceae bacterium]|nr:rhodanese-like domain-containing protein [Paracoccaceae bacterium]